MAKTYTNITDKIDDFMADANFSSNRVNETLRAVNSALDRISMGDIREDRGMDKEIAYDFQKKIVTVSFIDGTTDYTFSSLSITDFKFANDLRITTDENTVFTEVDNDYFFRKQGVIASTERMYTIIYNGSTQTLKINYSITDGLDFEYFGNKMVTDDSASLQVNEFTGDDADDTILIPDHLWLVVPTLAAADLAGQYWTNDSRQSDRFEQQGKFLLKRMINSIGIHRKNTSRAFKTRSEWFQPLTRISNN